MSRRAEQVGSTIKRAVQSVLTRGLADPRITGSIAVTRVTVSDDLRNATVHVYITPANAEALTMHGLRAAVRHVRHAISDKIALAKTPQLAFKLDQQYKAEAEVLALIGRASRELEEAEARRRAAQTSEETDEPGAEP